jgi:hypothetical protein
MRFAAHKELDEKRAEYERGKIGARLVRPLKLWPLVQNVRHAFGEKVYPGPMWCASPVV